MKSLRWWTLAVLLVGAPAMVPAEDLFDIKPVVDGVYAAIAKPQYKVNCNAAIVLLDDGVLVVDTHSKPSAARARRRIKDMSRIVGPARTMSAPAGRFPGCPITTR